MRVLTLTPFFPTANDDGAGCFIAEPIRALEELEVESYVIAVRPYHHGEVQPSPSAPSARWLRFAAIPGGVGLPTASRFLYARVIRHIRRLHQSLRFDLIHAHAALPCGHAAALLSRELRVPYVVTVHGLDVFLTAQVGGLAGLWCERQARSVYHSAARVICISGKVAARVEEGGNQGIRTSVVYNGVDAGMFAASGHDAETPTLLSIGNLIPIKGHEVFLRAAAAVRERFPELRCEIVGEGPELVRLRRLAEELRISSQVHFLGRQSRTQIVEAMRRCTIFALPSRYEGLGCVYLEAMASQRPAIACQGQGIDEIIRHGENGWLVEVGDWRGLADGMIQFLEGHTLRRKIGSAARQTVLRGFTLAHQAARLAQVYRECAA